MAVAVRSLLSDRLAGHAPRTCQRLRSRNTGLVVRQEMVLERGRMVVELLQPLLAPPCHNIDQELVEGVARLERLEVVGRGQEVASQHATDK